MCAATAYDLEQRPEPQAVEAEGHGAVHEVVGRRDGIEHGLDLFGLATSVAIGVDVFYVQKNRNFLLKKLS